jgi:uncharacterized peroxidase-related enzyme
MSRLTTPTSIATSPVASQPLLEAVQRQLGVVPNLFRVLGNSPAALEGYLALSAALSKGALDARTRERVAITVAEANECDYCLSAHTQFGRTVAKLDDAELQRNRDASSSDPKAAAALRFAAQVVAQRGHVTDTELQAVTAAGHTEAEVIELVLHVALNTLTNYVNSVACTAIDFPVVTSRRAA